ncbi:MAG: sigma-70 family RNA polymerase sigma factor [Bacteroidota bacterium]
MSGKPYYTDHQLISKICLQDTRALGEVYRYMSQHRLFYGQVEYLVTVSFPFNRMDAEDIFQQSFWDLVKRVREMGYRLEIKLSTVLYDIANKLCLKKKRWKKVRENHSEKVKDKFYGQLHTNASVINSDQEYLKRQLGLLVEKTLNQREKTLIMAVHCFNLSLKEYADIMEINYNTVKSLSRNALRKMKADPDAQALKNLYND